MDRPAIRRGLVLKVCSAGVLLAAAGGLWSAAASPSKATVRPPVRAASVPASAPTTTTALWPRPAWISVPVASVWDHRDSSRPVDAPVLGADPQVGTWLASLSLAQQLDLDDRLATQALLDDPVTALGENGGWAHVLVDEQHGAVYRSGIAGWIPVEQITFTPPGAATVTVDVPFAGQLSYGTQVTVLGSGASGLVVEDAAGDAVVPARDVRSGNLPASGESVVRQAQRFLGVPYLWAGTSAYGFDCSGLTYLVYRQFGVQLPRDAADQARAGYAVSRKDLQPGDLVFFDFGQGIDHVGIYAGNGMMIDSPKAGGRVEMVALWRSWMAPYFAGARQYLA